MSEPIPRDPRQHVLEMVSAFAGGLSPARLDHFRSELGTLLAEAPLDEVEWAAERMAVTQLPWGYTAPTPLAQRINHLMSGSALMAGSALFAAEQLNATGGKPVILLSNHLSYADAHLIQHLLHQAGQVQRARRLTAIGGPKVFEDPVRRYTSSAFGVITTPQSQTRSSGGPVMTAREAVQLARGSIEAAFGRLDAGDTLLLFPEGTRSRDGRMGELLPAIARYLDRPGTLIVPMGLLGSEGVMPMDDDRLHLAKVTATLGSPIQSDALFDACERNQQRMAETLGQAIAQLLPPQWRGAYANA